MYLSDMPEPFRGNLVNQKMPNLGETPPVDGPALKERRISMITTAGLHRHQEPPFVPGQGEFRIIPEDTHMADLITSHVAPNFDRTGMMRDINTVFPIDRLRELAQAGTIGSVAAAHYGFMGATPPTEYVELAKSLAADMKRDGVDGVLLAGV
jgi:D-proline reductase (dithiol) PrdB